MRIPRPRLPWMLGILWLMGWSLQLQSASIPNLEHLYPVAIQTGTTQTVAIVGSVDPWPPGVWVSDSRIEIHPEKESPRLRITVPASVPAGAYWVRLFNEQGGSGPRFLVVSDRPQTAETEPNDDFHQPQHITELPAEVNGRLDKNGDVDCYAFSLAAGQTIVASLEAYVLASPVDAVLRLVDTQGHALAQNHDDGQTLDPFLTWTATSAGTYVLQVFGFSYPAGSDVRFAGGAAYVYRCHLSSGPSVHHTLPIGIPENNATNGYHLVGWNLGSLSNTAFFPQTAVASNGSPLLTLSGESFGLRGLNTWNGRRSPGPEWMESQCRNHSEATPQLPVPGGVTGMISKPGEVDQYTFHANRGQRFSLEVLSATLGFPTDLWLAVQDLQGKELARNDDAVGADPALDWTAPESTNYVVAVGSLLHRGGPESVYRLTLQTGKPAAQIRVAASAFSLAPGSTNSISITVRRAFGFQHAIRLSTEGLPPGIKAESVDVAESANEAKIQCLTAPDAPAGNGEFRIWGEDLVSHERFAVAFDLISSGENNGVPNGYSRLLKDSIEQLWWTITLPPPTPKK